MATVSHSHNCEAHTSNRVDYLYAPHIIEPVLKCWKDYSFP